MTPDPRTPEKLPERVLSPQSAEDREDRARMMYRLRAYSRMTYPRLSEMFSLSEKQCQRIVYEYRDTRGAIDVDETVGRETLAEAIEELEDGMEKASIMYQAAVGDSQISNALGALNLRSRLMREKVTLMQEVGYLPRDLGTVRHVLELEEAARRILEVFRRYDVPGEVQDAVVLALEGGDGGDVVEGTLAAG